MKLTSKFYVMFYTICSRIKFLELKDSLEIDAVDKWYELPFVT